MSPTHLQTHPQNHPQTDSPPRPAADGVTGRRTARARAPHAGRGYPVTDVPTRRVYANASMNANARAGADDGAEGDAEVDGGPRHTTKIASFVFLNPSCF